MWASVSIFETKAGAEESNRMAADWVKQNIASFVLGPPEITAGDVVVHQAKIEATVIETPTSEGH